MRNPRTQISLTDEQFALVAVESSRTGDSMSACIRRALVTYYKEHQYTAQYQEELKYIKRIRHGEGA